MYELLTIDEYFQNHPEMVNDEWFNTSFESRDHDGVIQKGLLKFPGDCGDPTIEETWAPGGGFTGNCSIYMISDFSKRMTYKGRKKVEIPGGCDYIDSPDMHNLIPFELKPVKQLIEEELFNNTQSVFTYPKRVTKKFEKLLLTYVGETLCQSSKFPEHIVRQMQAELTPLEWKQVLLNMHRILYSHRMPSQEQPILLRIDGIDDGAVEGIFCNVEEARERLRFSSFFDTFQEPFFFTD